MINVAPRKTAGHRPGRVLAPHKAHARDAGLIPHPNVTKKIRLVIAADPDSLSGKARKAREYGIPIITEHAFRQILSNLVLPHLGLSR